MPAYKKYFFIGLGSLFTLLGITGIFIPILPTTPFLVLAAYLFARSSERCLNWLLTNRLFGSYISNYRSGKGLPLTQKILTLILLWVTIGYSAFFHVEKLWLKILLGLIALAVTIHLATIKTYKRQFDDNLIMNIDAKSALPSKDE
jgi:uncharacterized membrane protein YbaN (DUF454 family)